MWLIRQSLRAFRQVAPGKLLERWLAYSERRRLLDQALRTQQPFMEGRVLEVGAGRQGRRGRFSPPTEGVVCWLTLDLEPDRRPHVIADVADLPFPSRMFDVVVCLEVLEYTRDPRCALGELSRVLDEGGILILSTPFLHRVDSPDDRWRLTERGLRDVLAGAGFTVEVVEQQGAALVVIANTVKFPLSLVRPLVLRWLLGALIWLPLMLLRWLDGPAARRFPLLCDYSTGYLIRGRMTHPGSNAPGP